MKVPVSGLFQPHTSNCPPSAMPVVSPHHTTLPNHGNRIYLLPKSLHLSRVEAGRYRTQKRRQDAGAAIRIPEAGTFYDRPQAHAGCVSEAESNRVRGIPGAYQENRMSRSVEASHGQVYQAACSKSHTPGMSVNNLSTSVALAVKK